MEAAIQHYQNKLAFEMNPADLFETLEAEQIVASIDARKNFTLVKERKPGAISLQHRSH